MVSRTTQLLYVLPFALSTIACQRQTPARDEPAGGPQLTIVARDDDDHGDRDDDKDRDGQVFLPRQPGERVREQRPDKELRDILRAIDKNRLEATVQRLVAFGTRHTLSSQTDPVRGIDAATQWVYGQLQNIAATSGGRMTVELQTFLQQPNLPRIPNPTMIT